MSTAKTKDTGIPPEVRANAQAIFDHFTSWKPLTPEVVRRVRERTELIRQEPLARHGVQDIGVQIIRELRGELPES